MLTRKNGTVLPFRRVQALLYVIGNSRKLAQKRFRIGIES